MTYSRGYGLGPGASFYEVVTAAINDMAENGYDSSERLTFWVGQIRIAAVRSMTPLPVLQRHLDDTLRSIYRSKIERGGILRYHRGVSLFTLQQVAPRLHAELDRRIMANADLIKLNREQAVADTVQRFTGWGTSIPPGGSEAVHRVEAKTEIRKAMVSLPFRERRVAIDQGHKFVANLNEILAVDGGALAGIWHSHYREANYNYRKDHKERDDKAYVVRDNWALGKGFMKTDGHKYTDEITKPGEEVFCRCFYTWIYALRDLPHDMLTDKGRAELARIRSLRAA